MKTLAIDIETYSSVSLQKCGVYCDDELAAWEIVKKLTSNYRVWNAVADYIEQCFDLMTEKLQAAKE